jgi:hypothetical protein
MRRAVLSRSLLALLTVCCCLASCTGVSGDMNRLGEKLRVEVKRSLNEEQYARAYSVAIASCFFAREMEAVGDKPRTDGGTSSALAGTSGTSKPNRSGSLVYLGGNGMVEVSDARRGIERMVLNPKQPLDGLNVEHYESVLASVLPAEDIARLKQIRVREGYWTKLSTVEDERQKAIQKKELEELNRRTQEGH